MRVRLQAHFLGAGRLIALEGFGHAMARLRPAASRKYQTLAEGLANRAPKPTTGLVQNRHTAVFARKTWGLSRHPTRASLDSSGTSAVVQMYCPASFDRRGRLRRGSLPRENLRGKVRVRRLGLIRRLTARPDAGRNGLSASLFRRRSRACPVEVSRNTIIRAHSRGALHRRAAGVPCEEPRSRANGHAETD